MKTEKTYIIPDEAQPEIVIMVIKNRTAIQYESGFLGHISLVMQILNAAEDSGV